MATKRTKGASGKRSSVASVDTIFKGTGIIFIGLFLGAIMGYLTRMITVWLYGIEGYGLFSLASVIFNIFLMFVLWGITSGIMRFVSYYNAKNDRARARGAALSTLKFTLPLSIILMLVMIMFSGHIAGVFNEPLIRELVILFALALPFAVLMKSFIAGLRGLGQAKYKVFSDDLLKSSSIIVLLLLFWILGFSVMGVVAAYAIGFILAAVLSGYYLNKKMRLREKRVSVNTEIARFSLPLSINVFLFMIISWADIIILGIFYQASDVGIYNVALPTSELLLIISNSFLFMFTPVIAALYARKNMTGIRDVYNIMAKWVFMLILPLFVIMSFFSTSILGILFGPALVVAAIPLIILATGYFMDGITRLSVGLIEAMGKTRTILLNASIAAITNLVLNLILIPPYGIVGAAVATATSFIIYALLNVAFAYKYSGIQPIKLVFLKPVTSAFIATGIFFMIGKLLFMDVPLWYLLIMFPLFLLTYIVLLLMLKTFDRSDVALIKRLGKKLGIRTRLISRILGKFV